MKRREIIRKLAAGIPITLAAPSMFYACQEDTPGNSFAFDGKVIIIGAGISGIYAGYLLQQLGIEFTILEASDRFGGRLQTQSNFDDFPLELGGDEIKGGNSSFFQFLVNRSVTLSQVTKSELYVIDGIPKSTNDLLADAEFLNASNFIDNLKNYTGIDQSIGDRVTQAGITGRVAHVVEGKIGNRYGTVNSKLGSLGVAEAINTSESGEEIYRIIGSDYTNFIKLNFSSVISKINYNTPVSSINYSGETVEVTDAGGNAFSGELVIVTVPVSVLKDGDISFNPALSGDKIAALSTIGMDATMKVSMRFSKNFWGDTTSSLFKSGNALEYVSSGLSRGDRNRVLTTVITGDQAIAMGEMEDSAVMSSLVAELDQIYGGLVASINFIEGVVKDWTKEPFIRGGFSYPAVGSLNSNRSIIAQSVNNKLFFAGEATNENGNFGTIHGAVESAERAVEEIVAVLDSN